MTTDLLIAFVAFAFVTSITPGPNNMMLLASGLNFGLRRSLPHVLGISFGLMLLVLCTGFGLKQLFLQFPILFSLLRYLGAAYLLYLAWKIAHSSAPDDQATECGQPFGFLQAAAFQWVNPKAWIMAIGAITTYTAAQDSFYNSLLIAAVFALIGCPTMAVWLVAGKLLRKLLRQSKQLRIFNTGMALLLVASLYPIFSDLHGLL